MKGREMKTSALASVAVFVAVLLIILVPAGSHAQVTGEVTAVTGNTVEIRLDSRGTVRPGDRADLSYVTATGIVLPVGTWRVKAVRSGSVSADMVDSATAPVVGLKAKIYPAGPAETKPGKRPQAEARPSVQPAPAGAQEGIWLGFDISVIEDKGAGGLFGSMARIFGDKGSGRVGVLYVYSGSPAQAAGLRAKDIIVELNGKPVSTPEEFVNPVRQMPVGTKISVAVERDGSRIPVNIVLAAPPQYILVSDRAKEFYDRQQHADAVREYTRAIEMKPDVPSFYFYRGFSRYRINQFDAAANDFTKSIQLNPDYSIPYAFRGLMRSLTNRFDEAIADFDKALAMEPGTSWVYQERGMAKAMKKNFDGALSDIDRAIETSAQDKSIRSNLYFERARLCTDLGRPDDAMTAINKAIEIDEANPRAYGYRCHLHNQKRDYRRALADCNRSIELNRNIFAAYATRGETYEGMGYLKEALADMRQALQLNPQNKQVQSNVQRLTTKISGNR